MTYPTPAQVESASRLQLAKWWRFLDSPGMHAIGKADFGVVLDAEVLIMNRISERFSEAGGMTAEISKAIGW